ncbi:hypothetical protein IKF04_00590 [Candidatus Saccharibacteria bacterium]|nr:hypothetical protein [Candidatus Saccharibacteria bacterium]
MLDSKNSRRSNSRLVRRKRGGGTNLVLLGVISVVLAVVATSVSLIIYHNSGDIYLDRSRPGFLPDEEEAQEEKTEEEEYSFSRSGKITGEVLDELLKNLDIEIQAIDAHNDQFNGTALSDELLGIPEPLEEAGT